LRASGYLCPHLRCCQQIKLRGSAGDRHWPQAARLWPGVRLGLTVTERHGVESIVPLGQCTRLMRGTGLRAATAVCATVATSTSRTGLPRPLAREGCLEQQDKVAVALSSCGLRAALLTPA